VAELARQDAFGIVYPERVNISISACRDGNGNWKAVMTGMTGEYSVQASLGSEIEVTGPGGTGEGATTRNNFCEQLRDLTSQPGDDRWPPLRYYMVSAIQRHEQVHVARQQPEFEVVVRIYEPRVESLTVRDTNQSQADAVAQILRDTNNLESLRDGARRMWNIFDMSPNGNVDHGIGELGNHSTTCGYIFDGFKHLSSCS
jgi:hypothetical protein